MEETCSSPLSNFSLKVDSNYKATEFRLTSFSGPHMRAFHLAWLSLFTCFFSTFSTPLLPVIRDDLDLTDTDTDISSAGIASFSGAIFARFIMGAVCDLFGPRVASAAVSLVTAPIVVIGAAVVSTPGEFVVFRFLVGLSLGNFVANQYWMSSMFGQEVVGPANGVAAGWANVGGGAAQLLMPLIYSFICRLGVTSFTAWRVAFFIPAIFQASTALLVLAFGQDFPDADFHMINSKKEIQLNPLKIVCEGIKNYRGWILALTYGYCFGVELTVDNIIAQYFYDKFHLNLEIAGAIAASFGLANLFSRPAGGVISDMMGRRFGMRGRLWSLWSVQTMAGLLCIVLGRVNSLGGSIAVMVIFSMFLQAASGLTFGVVPFVSKRSLGVISGMTGSGGTVGAVITQLLLFSGSKYSKETGITLMDFMIVICTLPVSLIYFPHSGGMLCSPSQPLTEEDDYLLEEKEMSLG